MIIQNVRLKKTLNIVNSKYIAILILTLVYKIVLDFSYYYVISPVYYYMGLTTNIALNKIYLSNILTILVTIITPRNEDKLSSIYLNIQLLIFLIPMLTVYSLSDRSTIFILAICICHIIQCCIIRIPKINKKNHITLVNAKLSTILILSLLIALTFFLVILKYGLPNFSAFNFSKVYEIREQNVTTFPLSYLVPWMERIILPFIIIIALKKKNYIILVISIILQVFIYLIFAQKSYLFALFVVLAVYFCKKYNLLLKSMFLGLPFLVASTSCLYLYNPKYLILASLFVRRVLFVPADLKFRYFDFFSKNNKVYFADGMVGKIFNLKSPYDKTIPYVISEFVGRPESACNTGYWGDAYANMGFLGVFIFSILLILLIKFIEVKTKRIELTIVVACFSLPLYSLNDSALLTMLLTGGLLLLILIFTILDMKAINYPIINGLNSATRRDIKNITTERY